MRYKMTYILFLFFLLTTIPYIITIYINKENKKNISFENYDSGYKIQDKDQDIDLESYLLKILPGQISFDRFFFLIHGNLSRTDFHGSRRRNDQMPGCDLKDRSDPENGQIKEDKDGKHTISGVQRRTI